MRLVAPDNLPMSRATSPEGINLDVIGYDLVNAPAPVATDLTLTTTGSPITCCTIRARTKQRFGI